jgi:hypothetical protein
MPTTSDNAYPSQTGGTAMVIDEVHFSVAKGVIYYMKDEFGNECPYDFKNMLFTKTDSYTNAYTFNKIISGVANDVSVAQTSSQKCENNKMERYIDNGKHRLNYNVFNFSGSATASHALIGNVFDCNYSRFSSNRQCLHHCRIN